MSLFGLFGKRNSENESALGVRIKDFQEYLENIGDNFGDELKTKNESYPTSIISELEAISEGDGEKFSDKEDKIRKKMLKVILRLKKWILC